MLLNLLSVCYSFYFTSKQMLEIFWKHAQFYETPTKIDNVFFLYTVFIVHHHMSLILSVKYFFVCLLLLVSHLCFSWCCLFLSLTKYSACNNITCGTVCYFILIAQVHLYYVVVCFFPFFNASERGSAATGCVLLIWFTFEIVT